MILDNVAADYVHTRPINYTPGSTQSFQLARKWLSECKDSHVKCRLHVANFMPKRLVQIVKRLGHESEIASRGNSCHLEVPLTYSNKPEPYAALSYC